MKKLKRISLVQFYLHEQRDIEIDGSTAFLGPNGSGKSSTLDAIQIAMLGANLNYARFNTQSVSSKQSRSIASYCLGVLRSPDKDNAMVGRARQQARTYIILVFDDETQGGALSAGLCIEADGETDSHDIKGLFVLPGLDLNTSDCIQTEGEVRRPIPYADFREQIRERAARLGRTPTFTDKSSEYVHELLYALNGGSMPDPRRFMSSFVKSMTLKNVDSIDQFVRDYVVEPNPVDVAAFRKQVDQFVKLRQLIVETKARISKLEGILRDFEHAKRYERRIAALEAIRTIFEHESLVTRIDDLSDHIGILTEQYEKATELANTAKIERDNESQTITNLKVRLETNQDEQTRVRLEEQIKSRHDLINAYLQPETARANRLINALRDLVDDESFSGVVQTMRSAIDQLVAARIGGHQGVSVSTVLQDIESNLAVVRRVNGEVLSNAQREKGKLDADFKAARNQIAVAQQTGRLLSAGTSNFLLQLQQSGIEAQPVSALARIKDTQWAPALEAYLGGDREALVVLDGDTQDAVRVLRELRQRGENVRGTSIVQPYHLRGIDTSPKGGEFVVSLLESDNETVRQFLWNKFGSMRLVETEAELEEHARSITKDGMLSQGGLTKSIDVLSITELRVGKEFSDTSELSRYMAELNKQVDSLARRIKLIEALNIAMMSREGEEAGDAAEKLCMAAEDISEAEKQMKALDLSQLDGIKAAAEEANAKYESLDKDYTTNTKLAGGLSEQIKFKETERRQYKLQVPEIREAEKAALADPKLDKEWLDNVKGDIEEANPEYQRRIDDVSNKTINIRSRMKKSVESASFALTSYLNEETLDLQVALIDWNERMIWAREEVSKLMETELHRYEQQAEEARKASEETLRSDIAMTLNDRFREMNFERRERNKILESCPAFTGGERYRFTASVVPQYEVLVRYIEQIARDDGNFSLFAENTNEINETLRDLVEAAAESGNAGSVLDYRQFFTFDLEILVDGKRVDRMSNRQGAGSNGEHIAPMYVAAGAALAKAYRLHNRKGQLSGVGLMCLDEAFHGMDTMNAVATARFLQSIGLQLIMAGPELERTKLAPITQTIYDLDREGMDLLMERTKFKKAANLLMVSDMPSDNPDVMKNAYLQLGFEPPQLAPDAAQAEESVE